MATFLAVFAFPHLPLWLSWLFEGDSFHPLSSALVYSFMDLKYPLDPIWPSPFPTSTSLIFSLYFLSKCPKSSKVPKILPGWLNCEKVFSSKLANKS